MNGQIQHGDRLYFYIPSANCNRVENLFTFYTAANNSNLANLQDQPLAIKINDNEIYANVRFMFPINIVDNYFKSNLVNSSTAIVAGLCIE